ncbi:hypothetical protein [Planomonospora sp. ID82291]|uniref:hypothetical protein n=1 Tax=Planomonospora sp. ID82291 TaxID=2738136 RepID=UPI0018C40BA1|nr:hypothetical protein [Planomonospora sp. ID82291]MBG0815510.1 hypothetical protein [Planomonospora sp. ID82291]
MAGMGKLGAGVGICGGVLLAVGVTGMAMWPTPAWAAPAFVAGMMTTFAGVFTAAWSFHTAAFRRGMSVFEDRLGAEKAGGLFEMIRDMTRGNDDLLAGGVPAAAVVLSMRDTGMTVNDQPLVGFELEVRPEGAAPYRVAHRETLPRLLVGAVLPGSALSVRIDPADPRRLAVDWSRPPGRQEPVVAEHLSAADLLARGLPGTATVTGTFDLNGMTADNGDPIVGFVLQVAPGDGRAPYQVRLGHRVPPAHLHRTVPGTRLPVRIAAEDPEKVAVDWEGETAAHARTAPTPF